MYLTLAIDEDTARANQRLDAYLAQYYHQPAAAVRTRQACYAGAQAGAAEWLAGYAAAGASHLVLRFAGEHERHLDMLRRNPGKARLVERSSAPVSPS